MSRLLTLCLLVASIAVAACGGGSSPDAPASPSTSTRAPVIASASAPAAPVSPSPAPTRPSPPPSPPPPSPPPASPTAESGPLIVWVTNTDGGGVFLRNSPVDGDRTSTVLADNTPLTVTGELIEGDGENWYPVTTDDGSTGYVPGQYTTMTDPGAGPQPLVPRQAR
jgi:hypothetical protein